MEIYTQNPKETQKLGQTIGTHVIKTTRGKKARILALYGELGSGKTTFVQGLAKAFGIPRRIVSPTFILIRRYSLSIKNFLWFYHIDLYRLIKETDMEDVGILEIFQDPNAIIAVEWAERLGTMLPKNRIDIFFYANVHDTRHIKIVNLHNGFDLAIH